MSDLSAIWDHVAHQKRVQEAPFSVKFTCGCGWIREETVTHLSLPVDRYIPEGWDIRSDTEVCCPDCTRRMDGPQTNRSNQ